MNLWTLKKLVIGANAEGVRKVKAAFRFDCGAASWRALRSTVERATT